MFATLFLKTLVGKSRHEIYKHTMLKKSRREIHKHKALKRVPPRDVQTHNFRKSCREMYQHAIVQKSLSRNEQTHVFLKVPPRNVQKVPPWNAHAHDFQKVPPRHVQTHDFKKVPPQNVQTYSFQKVPLQPASVVCSLANQYWILSKVCLKCSRALQSAPSKRPCRSVCPIKHGLLTAQFCHLSSNSLISGLLAKACLVKIQIACQLLFA